MGRSLLALLVVFMMLAPAGASLALTPQQTNELTKEPSAVRSHVTVVDITAIADEQDMDKLYDSLQLLTRINFTRSGDYVVVFKLAAPDGSWWLTASENARVDLAEGASSHSGYFEASFEGWKLNSRKVDGELVAVVEVEDLATAELLARLAKTIGPYSYWQFEPPNAGAEVVDILEGVPLDFDGNGRAEILELPVVISARGGGLYRVSMAYNWTPALSGLRPETKQSWVTNWTELAPGRNVVPMWVSGQHAMTTEVLEVGVAIYKGAFWGGSYTEDVTVPDGRQFEMPNLRDLYTGTHREVGIDRDGDSLYDVLGVQVHLEVSIPGAYKLVAYLVPATAEANPTDGVTGEFLERVHKDRKAARSTVEVDLEPGERHVWFQFEGNLINAWDHDGPFIVHVLAYGSQWYLFTYFHFDTQSLVADEFVHPVVPVVFTSGHSDRGILEPDGDRYSHLEVTFNIKVNVPGTYTAFGVLLHEGVEVAYVRLTGGLSTDDGSFSLRFPGPSINAAGVSGTFVATVRVQGGGYAWNDTTFEQPMGAIHETDAYSSEMFVEPNLNVDRRTPQPVEDLEAVILKTGIMAVRIDRNQPDLLFYMTRDDGQSALFRVMFTRLLALSDDNGNGLPEPSEVVYTSSLRAYEWEMTEVTLAEDERSGRIASFEMSSLVDLTEYDSEVTTYDLDRPLATVEGFARLTLSFTLSSRDVNRTDEVGTIHLLGGAELKVDIGIEVLTPVDGIDFITLEQLLRDDRGQFLPRPSDEEANTASPDTLTRYQDSQDLKQRVEFKRSGDAPGFYSWVRRAEVTSADGSTTVEDVRAAYMVTDGHMLLYLSYPYQVETVHIYHDPSIGVFEDFLESIPEEWRSLFDPLLFGISAVAAVAVVYGLRGRPRRPEEEEMEWEDDEPLEPQRPPAHPPGGPPATSPPPEAEPREHDAIEHLPEEPVRPNGSTLGPHPPPGQGASQPPRAGWVEWQE